MGGPRYPEHIKQMALARIETAMQNGHRAPVPAVSREMLIPIDALYRWVKTEEKWNPDWCRERTAKAHAEIFRLDAQGYWPSQIADMVDPWDGKQVTAAKVSNVLHNYRAKRQRRHKTKRQSATWKLQAHADEIDNLWHAGFSTWEIAAQFEVHPRRLQEFKAKRCVNTCPVCGHRTIFDMHAACRGKGDTRTIAGPRGTT